eukprot:6462146-Amphidinium_carterae.3
MKGNISLHLGARDTACQRSNLVYSVSDRISSVTLRLGVLPGISQKMFRSEISWSLCSPNSDTLCLKLRSRGAYIQLMIIDEDMTKEQASASWERQLESLPAARVAPDRKRILWPVEKFVVTLNSNLRHRPKRPNSTLLNEFHGWVSRFVLYTWYWANPANFWANRLAAAGSEGVKSPQHFYKSFFCIVFCISIRASSALYSLTHLETQLDVGGVTTCLHLESRVGLSCPICVCVRLAGKDHTAFNDSSYGKVLGLGDALTALDPGGESNSFAVSSGPAGGADQDALVEAAQKKAAEAEAKVAAAKKRREEEKRLKFDAAGRSATLIPQQLKDSVAKILEGVGKKARDLLNETEPLLVELSTDAELQSAYSEAMKTLKARCDALSILSKEDGISNLWPKHCIERCLLSFDRSAPWKRRRHSGRSSAQRRTQPSWAWANQTCWRCSGCAAYLIDAAMRCDCDGKQLSSVVVLKQKSTPGKDVLGELEKHGGDGTVYVEKIKMADVADSIRAGGPMNMRERFQWPEAVWAKLTGGQKDRLIRNLKCMEASSHFSGMGGMEHILAHIVSEVNRHLVTPLDPISSVHVCEIEKSRQAVLKEFVPEHRPRHVFGDLHDRLPRSLQRAVMNEMPGPDASLEVRKWYFYRLFNMLDEHYSSRNVMTEHLVSCTL